MLHISVSPTAGRLGRHYAPDFSIGAVLIAEACNIGLEPLGQANIPALTLGGLAGVQKNYINLLGRYQLAVPETVLRGELRPLRDPSILDE